jgi:hypothetical protein
LLRLGGPLAKQHAKPSGHRGHVYFRRITVNAPGVATAGCVKAWGHDRNATLGTHI